ncbi:hypothetical protein CTAM01_15100 [Colletotrichum tamarilloi]|uniref:Fungal N-terminal domain-containing protein n=1 Tax=Colletotrichum tamarilloi TaxID=1209934 RepID=A0ABQ9QMG1_9PEZI|nr:uncharacterized protein CTAM01_15100 [Colletotrichum tamarilloi]KAK1477715.1 hypothetical protein CTAM01_15100 [Colletotrichum tamarilloi]
MAEIVGVAAAASQLAVSCFAILELMKKIKDAPSALKDYQTHLQELCDLSTSISLNPLLQTKEIGSQTLSLQAIVNQYDIESILSRSRLLQSLGFLRKERDLKNTLNILERRKSHLSLIIHNIEASTLHQIQSDIRVMANRPLRNRPESLLLGPKHDAAEFEKQAGGSSSTTSGDSVALVKSSYGPQDWKPAPALHTYMHPQRMTSEAEQSHISEQHQGHPLPTGDRSSSQDWPQQEFPFGSEVRGRSMYYNCTAGKGVNQINGAYVENDSNLLDQMAMQRPGPHFNYTHFGNANPTASSYMTQPSNSADNALLFINCTKSGPGEQINNIHATYDRDLCGLPVLHAYYSGCNMLSGQGPVRNGTVQRQINGPSLRRLKKANTED